MKYYIIAGEASGDLHGSNLMKGLYAADPQCDVRFWGGDRMAAVGGTMVRHYKGTAVMGFVEVLAKANKILGNLTFCKKDILEYSPDVVILIDYAGFNLKIARFAKEHGIRTFYYIAPKVWAWKEGRITKLRKYVDKLFIIFPFEIDYFHKKGIDAIYRGNPLIDSIANHRSSHETRTEFLQRHHLEDKPIIALLAGSRKTEISWLLPRFKEAAALLPEGYQILLAGAPSIELEYYRKYIEGSNIKLIPDDTYGVLRNAEAAVVASGTASLETALIGTPQVVCYGGNPISFWIAKQFILHSKSISYISLGNLIINRQAFRELLQDDCTGKTISDEVVRLISDPQYRGEMLHNYSEIRKALGGEGASVKVAEAMIEELKKQ
ncbi:MAG: lipid-A-disaccharide synthase [Bacteroidales bacterium]|nr:lipid-A-disaccharide synthase [Bacteroidales bacterium]